MAHITTLPNFFNAASPAAADFNNAAKAILGQIGGTYYDESAAAYARTIGNLDGQNIAATAGFRNSQKAEPYSTYTLTAWAETSSISASTDVPVFFSWPLFAPILRDGFIASIGLHSTNSTDSTVAGQVWSGTFDLYLNGSIAFGGITFDSIVNQGTNPTNDPAIGKRELPVRVGDIIHIDPTNLKHSAASGLTWLLYFTLYMKSLHIRKNE